LKIPHTSLSIFSCSVATTVNVFLAKTKKAFKFSHKDLRQCNEVFNFPVLEIHRGKSRKQCFAARRKQRFPFDQESVTFFRKGSLAAVKACV